MSCNDSKRGRRAEGSRHVHQQEAQSGRVSPRWSPGPSRGCGVTVGVTGQPQESPMAGAHGGISRQWGRENPARSPSSCHSAVPSSGHVWCRARGERDTLGSPVYSQSGAEGEVGFEKPGVDSRLSIRSGWCARKKRNAVTATWKRREQRVVQAGIQFSLLVRWLRVCECTYLLKCTCIPQINTVRICRHS